MEYTKIYIKTHIKFFGVYLLSIPMLLPAMISILFGFFLMSIGVSEDNSMIIILLIAGLILSSPVITINYFIARDYKKEHNLDNNVYVMTVLNHLVTYIVYVGGYFIWMAILNMLVK